MSETPWARRLPRSNQPLPGESLAGYLLNLAHRLDLSPADVIKRTGIKTLTRVSVLDLSYSVTLPLDAAQRLGTASGLTDAQVTGLTLDSFGTVLDMARPGKRIARSNYGNKWVNPGRTRACPDCLRESPHPVWSTRWIMPWALACTIHGTLLIDQCPACGTSLGDPGPGSIRSLIPSVASPVEHPAACRSTTGRVMCNHRFDQADPIQAQPHLLFLQQRLNQAVANPTADGNQWLRDLRLIALLLVAVGLPDDLTPTPYADAARQHAHERRHNSDKARDHSIPPGSGQATAGLLLAADKLLKNAEASDDLADLNRQATEQAPTPWEQAKNKSGPSLRLHEALHRHKRSTTRPQRLAAYLPTVEGLAPEHIPAYLPAALFDAHLADARHPSGTNGQRSRYERPLRRYAPIAVAMHASQIDATTAGRLLGYPDTLTAAACARASEAFRDHGGEPELFRRIAAITSHYATAARIDYRRRRDHFDAGWRIPDDEWTPLQTSLARNNRPWQIRHIEYSAWVWSLITIGDPLLAPMTRIERNGRQSTNGTRLAHDHRRWGNATLRYLDALAARLAATIDADI
ncbi:TniQ family protein [Nocardioides sp.]|uniref:TniQ family protein n=1 Tax=Nocardioides sp. TaxID=35761 RepID=UPI0025D64DB0|nr:TniQ family protein [Nocardioides sp.]